MKHPKLIFQGWQHDSNVNATQQKLRADGFVYKEQRAPATCIQLLACGASTVTGAY